MIEVYIYVIGLLLWFWFVPKYMPKDPTMSDDGILEIKFATVMGVFWPVWIFVGLASIVFGSIGGLFDRYIKFRTKNENSSSM